MWSSANGEYVGIDFVTEKIKEGKKEYIKKFALWNRSGKKLWEIDKGFRYGFAVSNRGRVVDGNVDDDNKIDFYDEKGRIIKQVGYADIVYGDQSCTGKFSENGEYFLLTGNNGGPWDKTFLVLYNKEGDELWKKVIEGRAGWSYGQCNISKEGNYIMGSRSVELSKYLAEVWISVFNNEGKLLWEYKASPTWNFIPLFSEDEKYLLISSSRNRLRLFKSQDGKLLWEANLEPGLKLRFISLDISVDNKYIIVGGYSFNGAKQPYVYLLDFNGKMIWKQEYGKGGQYDFFHPQIYPHPTVKFVTSTEFNATVGDKAFNYVIHQK